MRDRSAAFRIFPVVAAFAVALFAVSAAAQNFPTKPIRIIVPTPPGGAADIVGRTFAHHLSTIGHTGVVENRTGGAGQIAAEAVARSAPDGYTVYVGFHGTQSILPHLFAKLPYDPSKDFQPIMHAVTAANILVLHPSVPAKSVRQLVDYAKANPGKLSTATQGVGSTGHVGAEQFKQITGADIAIVHYKGAAPARTDLIAGHIPMMFDIVPLAQETIKSGKVRALAVAAPQRVGVLPEVPTMAEAGFPGVEAGAWFGFLVRAGTPQPIVEWLNREAQKAFSDPKVNKQLSGLGYALPLGPPEKFGAFIEAETKRWGEVIRRAGIKPE